MANRKTSNQQRKRPECHTPDLTITHEIVSKMRKNLEEDLNNCNALLKREEQLAVQYVIFYVFKECKIFNKPPEKQL